MQRGQFADDVDLHDPALAHVEGHHDVRSPVQGYDDTVPDEVFETAAKYYEEPALTALVLHIVNIDSWNRLNVITGQVAGEWTAQWVS